MPRNVFLHGSYRGLTALFTRGLAEVCPFCRPFSSVLLVFFEDGCDGGPSPVVRDFPQDACPFKGDSVTLSLHRLGLSSCQIAVTA